MADEVLQFERRGAVGIVTLNRPDHLNALDFELIRALLACFAERATDAATRVLVLTGAGRAFCAGLDLKAVPAQLPWQPGLGPAFDIVTRLSRRMVLVANS
jgi:enoyl-CoA hydratase/carnithine racemase